MRDAFSSNSQEFEAKLFSAGLALPEGFSELAQSTLLKPFSARLPDLQKLLTSQIPGSQVLSPRLAVQAVVKGSKHQAVEVLESAVGPESWPALGESDPSAQPHYITADDSRWVELPTNVYMLSLCAAPQCCQWLQQQPWSHGRPKGEMLCNWCCLYVETTS